MPEDDGWECRLRPLTTQLLHRLNSTMQTRIAEVLGPLAEEWAGGLKLRSALFKKAFFCKHFFVCYSLRTVRVVAVGGGGSVCQVNFN